MKKLIYWIVFFVAVVLVVNVLVKSRNQQTELSPSPTIISIPIPEPTSKVNKLVLAENVFDEAPANVEKGGFSSALAITGELKEAWLKIEVSVSDDALVSDWDDVYLLFSDRNQFRGGHFVNPDPTWNEIEIDLTQAEYYEKLGREGFIEFDFVSDMLNFGIGERTIYLDMFISSARPAREIKKVELNYVCEGECEVKVSDN